MAAVGRPVGDLVMHDQARVGIDCGPYVVAGRLVASACPHRTGIFLAFNERRAFFRVQLVSHPVEFGASVV